MSDIRVSGVTCRQDRKTDTHSCPTTSTHSSTSRLPALRRMAEDFESYNRLTSKSIREQIQTHDDPENNVFPGTTRHGLKPLATYSTLGEHVNRPEVTSFLQHIMGRAVFREAQFGC